MTTHRTPGRSGISARFLSNFPLPAGGGLSGPHSGGQLRAVGTAPSRHLQAVAGFLSAASGQGSSGMIQRSKSKAQLERRNAYEMAALNPFTAAYASQAPHESTWSLSNRMHTASGAVR